MDDEADIVKVVSMRLRKSGYAVISALNGEAALELVHTEKPDLILLDISLPKLNGYQVCRLLKSDKDYEHTPVIFLTASAEDMDLQASKGLTYEGYILKPFEAETLLEKVRRLLG